MQLFITFCFISIVVDYLSHCFPSSFMSPWQHSTSHTAFTQHPLRPLPLATLPHTQPLPSILSGPLPWQHSTSHIASTQHPHRPLPLATLYLAHNFYPAYPQVPPCQYSTSHTASTQHALRPLPLAALTDTYILYMGNSKSKVS